MKKIKILWAVALLVCTLSVLMLTACNFEIEGEGSWDMDADTKEDCVMMLNDLLEETLKDPNVVVTVKSGERVYYTETIVGENDCTVYSETNKAYAVKDGEDYLMISTSADGNYYVVDKTMYDYNYCRFKNYIVDYVDAFEEGIFVCHKHVDDKDRFTKDGTVSESKGTLTFTYTSTDGESAYTIEAEEENGLVRTVTVTMSEGEESSSITLTFSYGNAAFEVPDYKSWDMEGDGDGEGE